MELHIDENELTLLAQLHETVRGYGEAFYEDANYIREGVQMSPEEFSKASSFLAEHRLAGINTDVVGGDGGRPDTFVFHIWLTGLGEDYMRTLEAQPSIGRKITVAVLKEAKGVTLAVAGSVLTAFVERFIPMK